MSPLRAPPWTAPLGAPVPADRTTSIVGRPGAALRTLGGRARTAVPCRGRGVTAAPEDVVAPRVRTGQTRAVVLGGAVSSVAAYAFQILGARVLGDDAYAPVGILWTVQYLVLTIGLLSSEAYVTRCRGVTDGVWWWVGGLAAAVAAVVALVAPDVLGSGGLAWPLVAAAIVVGFGLFAVVRGQLAAARRYRAYGVMTGGESVLRLLVAAGLLAAGAGAAPLAATLPAGAALVALPWLPSVRRVRAGAVDVAEGPSSPVEGAAAADLDAVDDDPAGPLPFLARTTAANGAAQLLLAAGPLVVAALGGGGALVTVVFVTTTAARAPMVFVHSGVLARILPPMRAMAERGRHGDLGRLLRRGAAPVAGVLALMTLAGAALGPTLVALAFGADLRPSAGFAALTALSVGLAMLGLLLNQVAIAVDGEAHLLLPWSGGVAAAAAVLALPGGLPLDLRVAAASAGGLLVADALVRVRLSAVLRGATPSQR
jgi:hypothetical protein